LILLLLCTVVHYVPILCCTGIPTGTQHFYTAVNNIPTVTTCQRDTLPLPTFQKFWLQFNVIKFEILKNHIYSSCKKLKKNFKEKFKEKFTCKISFVRSKKLLDLLKENFFFLSLILFRKVQLS